MTDTTRKLRDLQLYYMSTRAIGHTWTMMHGLIESPRAVLLAHTHNYGKHLKREAPNCRVVSWASDLVALRGLQEPLAIDNAAMLMILSDALKEINNRDSYIDELHERIRQLERKQAVFPSETRPREPESRGLSGDHGQKTG